MALRPIVLYPDPVLLKPTRVVETVDAEVRRLVEDMIETMRAAPGIGLAANQVGVSSRVCIVDVTGGDRVTPRRSSRSESPPPRSRAGPPRSDA
ncbi:MAG: peptide deformylase [Acidobacteriota bacterium]|nr:peptide deformylase [Acidobacteriota bacterium]